MHQDEAGRWVSDNGRYLWDGAEWLDLEPDAAEEPDAAAQGATLPSATLRNGRAQAPEQLSDARSDARSEPGNDLRSEPGNDPRHEFRADAATEALDEPLDEEPFPSSAAAVATDAPPRRSRRRGAVLLGLLVLVVVVVVAVLVVGNRSSSRPPASATSPAPGAASPGPMPPSPSSDAVLDEQQRRDRAERALVSRTDFPATTEQRPVNPADVFLPCRAPALTPPPGTVLVGRTVSNSDFTVYVGQTIAGYATPQQAADALEAVRTALGKCAPYDYDYANSPRVDRITHADVGTPLDVADGGVYLAEIDTPANYTGTTTTYSYGYVRRGQFLVRLTLTNRSQADRGGVERLMQRITSELG